MEQTTGTEFLVAGQRPALEGKTTAKARVACTRGKPRDVGLACSAEWWPAAHGWSRGRHHFGDTGVWVSVADMVLHSCRSQAFKVSLRPLTPVARKPVLAAIRQHRIAY